MRVLIVLPASDELRTTSSAMIAGTTRRLNAESLNVPSWIPLDLDYPPVAIGILGQPFQELGALSVSESQAFLVRSEIPDGVLGNLRDHFGEDRVFSDPDIEALIVCRSDPAVGATHDIETNLDVTTLATCGMTGAKTALAIMDSGINRIHLMARGLQANIDQTVYWKRPRGVTPGPGLHPVNHGTMCAYDALIAAPQATLLDYPILGPTPISSSRMGGLLSNALSAYSHLLSWWSVEFGPSRQNYDALVVSNSWGMYHPSWDFPSGHPGRYLDNRNHPFNQLVHVLSDNHVDILFAAGNCGTSCPFPCCRGNTRYSIMGANAHPDVLCIGGVDTKDNWVGYSSEGPAVPGMDPCKPNIAAYTHFDGSRICAGVPDNGTSAACPVAAGCVAALRTRISQSDVSPARMASVLEDTARKPSGATGWDPKLGHGIIDPLAAGRRLLSAIP